MKLLTTLALVLIWTGAFSQKFDVIGDWEGYKVLTKNPKKEALADSLKFRSILSMNADSTFTLVTSGFEVVMGKFQVNPNVISLYKLIGFEDYQLYWEMRWSPPGKDPYADTPEIDMMIPTQAEVKNLKKKTVYTTQVYALYKRIE